jgi:hypothetical protein
MSHITTSENISFQTNNLLSSLFDKDSFLSKHTMSFLPGRPGREWTFDEAVSSGHLYLVEFLYPDFRTSQRFLEAGSFIQALQNHTNSKDSATKTRYFNVIKFVLKNCWIARDVFFGKLPDVAGYDLDILNLLFRKILLSWDNWSYQYFYDLNILVKEALNLKRFDVIIFLLKNKVVIDDDLLFQVYEKADIKTIRRLFLSGIRPVGTGVDADAEKIVKGHNNIIFFCGYFDDRGDDEDDDEIFKSTLVCFYKINNTIKREVWKKTEYFSWRMQRFFEYPYYQV